MDRIEERSRGDGREARLAAIEGRLDEIARDVASCAPRSTPGQAGAAGAGAPDRQRALSAS